MLLRSLLLVLLASAAAVGARAQEQHVYTQYVKDDKQTRVYTDLMYVLDTPAQFLLVQLEARYKGQQLTEPPRYVGLDIRSVTRSGERLYRYVYRRGEPPRKLTVIADGQRMQFDRPPGVLLIGEVSNRHDRFRACMFEMCEPATIYRPGLGPFYESPLPDDAQVRGRRGVEGLYMEETVVWIELPQFLKIAAARKVEVELEKTTFSLTENQVGTVREFARRITP